MRTATVKTMIPAMIFFHRRSNRTCRKLRLLDVSALSVGMMGSLSLSYGFDQADISFFVSRKQIIKACVLLSQKLGRANSLQVKFSGQDLTGHDAAGISGCPGHGSRLGPVVISVQKIIGKAALAFILQAVEA